LTARARGREELAKALAQRGFSRSAAQGALERLEREGWLDDLAAASALVRGRSGRYGRKRIERELCARGFSKETIERALSQADPGREAKSLQGVFERLQASTAGLAPETRRRRIWNALLRRGFAAEAVSAIMKGDHEIDGGS
jgi:regulatory protein